MKIADGQSLYNGSEVLSGTITDMSKLNGKTLRPYKTITLADAADNSSAIREWNGSVAEVTLQGRTLTKDGNWNTLCLPFSLTEEQIAASPLAGATIKTMDDTAGGTRLDRGNGTLTLRFNTATTIEAGRPYIVKWPVGFTINNNADWKTFVGNVAEGTTYEGQLVKLNADVSISAGDMVGTAYYPFKGIFDGGGHTITSNINYTESDYT